jgi:hypothetical protein
VNVFEALKNSVPADATAGTSPKATETSASVKASVTSNWAAKNEALLGIDT